MDFFRKIGGCTKVDRSHAGSNKVATTRWIDKTRQSPWKWNGKMEIGMKILDIGPPVASSGCTTGVMPGLNHHRSAKPKVKGKADTKETKQNRDSKIQMTTTDDNSETLRTAFDSDSNGNDDRDASHGHQLRRGRGSKDDPRWRGTTEELG